MERPNYSDQDFADTLEMEALIIKDAREKFASGQLSGRRYEPLPEGDDAAFNESDRREQASLAKAKQDLSERRSIYG